MAITWAEVTKHPDYAKLSKEEKEQWRNEYFAEVVAPQFRVEELDKIREEFDADTKPKAEKGFFGTAVDSVSDHFSDYGSKAKIAADQLPKDIRRLGDAAVDAASNWRESSIQSVLDEDRKAIAEGATLTAKPPQRKPQPDIAGRGAAFLNEMTTGPAPAQPGIDTSRPIIENADGSFSTERTITIGPEDDGQFYVIPTIVDGKPRTPDEAVELFRQGKNKHVGSFGSLQDAEQYAKARSNEIGTVRGKDRVAAASMPGRTWGAFAADTGIDVGKGVIGFGEGIVGLADILTGNMAGKGLEAIGYDPEQAKAFLTSKYSKSRAEANKQVEEAEGFVDTIAALADNPSAAVGIIVESAPLMLGSAATARWLAARLLAKAGIAPGTVEAAKYLSQPGVRSAITAIATGTEGAITAGQIQEQARQAGRDWSQSVAPAVAAGVITAGIGYGTSKIPGLRDVEATVGTSGMAAEQRKGLLAAGKEIAKAIFKEGPLEELPQSAQEQIFTNLALGKPWNEGVGESAAMGLVAGMGMGGTAQAYNEAISSITSTTPEKEFARILNRNDPSLTEAEAEQIAAMIYAQEGRIPDENEVAPPSGPMGPAGAQFGPVQPPELALTPEQLAAQEEQDRLDQQAAADLGVPVEEIRRVREQQEMDELAAAGLAGGYDEQPLEGNGPLTRAGNTALKEQNKAVQQGTMVGPYTVPTVGQPAAPGAPVAMPMVDDQGNILPAFVDQTTGSSQPLPTEATAEPISRPDNLDVPHGTNIEPQPILRSDGTPFATKAAAKRARTNQGRTKTHGITEVDGGFAMVPMTPEEIAAQDEADKPSTALPPQEKARRQKERNKKANRVDPENDDILAAVAKYGGLNSEEALADGYDPADMKNRFGSGIKRVFTKNGRSFDGMAEALAQDGYPVLDENGNPDPRKVDDLVRRALKGEKVHSTFLSDQKMQEVYGQEEPDRPQPLNMEELDQLSDEEFFNAVATGTATDNELAALLADEAEESGTTADKDMVEAITRAMAALGEDEVEAIMERTAAQTDGQSDEAYNTALIDALEGAIDEKRNRVNAQGESGSQAGTGQVEGANAGKAQSGPQQDVEVTGLEQYTEEDLEKMSAQEREILKAEAEAAKRAKADEELADFTLTGSSRPVDLAEARGQTNLFDAPQAQEAPQATGDRATRLTKLAADYRALAQRVRTASQSEADETKARKLREKAEDLEASAAKFESRVQQEPSRYEDLDALERVFKVDVDQADTLMGTRQPVEYVPRTFEQMTAHLEGLEDLPSGIEDIKNKLLEGYNARIKRLAELGYAMTPDHRTRPYGAEGEAGKLIGQNSILAKLEMIAKRNAGVTKGYKSGDPGRLEFEIEGLRKELGLPYRNVAWTRTRLTPEARKLQQDLNKSKKPGETAALLPDDIEAQIREGTYTETRFVDEPTKVYKDLSRDEIAAKAKGDPAKPEDEEEAGETIDEYYARISSNNEGTVRAAETAGPFISQAEADAILEEWRAVAQNQNKSMNAGKTVISLFDRTGVWSAPWVEAGYNVIQLDIENGVDVNDITIEWLADAGIDDADVILAACPCTDFAASGARWWAEKDANGTTKGSVALVGKVLAMAEFFRPRVLAIENPVGRIEKMTGLPRPRLIFQPHHYGDPYTKKTLIYGYFDPDLPQANVEPTEGSRTVKLSGKGRGKADRSVTPEGFAYAFFMANRDPAADGKQPAKTAQAGDIVAFPYWSGSSRPRDFNAAIASGAGVGVVAGELSKNMTQQVIGALARGNQVFVDSGAFSLYRKAIAEGKAPEDLHAESRAAFGEAMDKYKEIIDGVVAAGKQANLGGLQIVAPDIIGSQRGTLEVMREHGEQLREWADMGVEVIIPLQTGEDSPSVFWGQIMMDVFQGADVNVVAGIPSKAAAMPNGVLKQFVAYTKPSRLHILGAAANASRALQARMKTINEASEDGDIGVTADAVTLRTFIAELRGLKGQAKFDAMVAKYKEKIPEIWVRNLSAKSAGLAQPNEYGVYADTGNKLMHTIRAGLTREGGIGVYTLETDRGWIDGGGFSHEIGDKRGTGVSLTTESQAFKTESEARDHRLKIIANDQLRAIEDKSSEVTERQRQVAAELFWFAFDNMSTDGQSDAIALFNKSSFKRETLSKYSADGRVLPQAGLRDTKVAQTYEIDETGEQVTIEENAAELLAELDSRLDKLHALRECI